MAVHERGKYAELIVDGIDLLMVVGLILMKLGILSDRFDLSFSLSLLVATVLKVTFSVMRMRREKRAEGEGCSARRQDCQGQC